MLYMTDSRAESPLGDFIKRHLQKRGWSLRTLAMYAELAPSSVANAVAGRHVPSPETLRRIAEVLEVDETHLLRLAGHIEEDGPQGLNDPSVIALAYRLEDLPPSMRQRAIQAMDAMIEMAGPVVLSDVDKQARIAELKKAIREAQKYLASLEGGESSLGSDSQ